MKKVACIGVGVIGAGWAARMLWNGVEVLLYDQHPRAQERFRAVMDNADYALDKLTVAPRPQKGSLRFCDTLEEAVADADMIIESVPENEALKQSIYEQVEPLTRTSTLICSSSSGLLPSRLQSVLKHPERFLIAHPFQPVYLLPLVELCGGEKTDVSVIESAKQFFTRVGMKPLHVKKEIDAYVADRLLEALWREALWLVNDDVATVEEVDDAIVYGAGMRWALMGSFLTYRIAGGEDGMKHFLSQFGPALKWPWTKLMDTPELTDALVDKISEQSDAQAGDLSIRQLERIRDEGLIAIQQSLKSIDYASGKVLSNYEQQLYSEHKLEDASQVDIHQPLSLYRTQVRPEWTDYNGHMTESRYLQVFGDASDAFYAYIGLGADQAQTQGSFYTAETHLCHVREVAANEPIVVRTQLLGFDEKRLHLVHCLYLEKDDQLLATAEQMMLYVDAASGKVAPAPESAHTKIEVIFNAHKALALPGQVGRRIQTCRNSAVT